MIKIDLNNASRDPLPWKKKEFKDWNEAIPELLKLYKCITIDEIDNDGEYVVYLYDGYME